MGLKLKKTVVIFLSLLTCFSAFALNVPALKSRITDNAGVIKYEDKAKLTQYLEEYERKTGIQIAVLTIKSLEGESIEGYSMRVAENWKLGQADKDNGVLLVVSMDERMLRIEVGYGLEDKLTDAICGSIIRTVIIPQFKEGKYSEGITLGVETIGHIASMELSEIEKTINESSEEKGAIPFLFIIFIFIAILFISSLGPGRLFWGGCIPRNFNSHPGKSFNGGMGSHLGGTRSGGFGGSFGGGFHGGGGHFGGGGASGHW